VEIVRAETIGEIRTAAHLFDNPIDDDALAAFVAREGHHLLLAVYEGRSIGFVSAVELVHPDKGMEWFIYELGVDDGFRRRGVAKRLVEEVERLAREAGAYGMFVLTDLDNEGAQRTYLSTGGEGPQPGVLFDWRFASDG
jgi:ribosomal protein S18 acetylase RimI-like enzyme